MRRVEGWQAGFHRRLMHKTQRHVQVQHRSSLVCGRWPNPKPCAAGGALRAGLVIVASQKGLTVAVPVLAALAAGRAPVLAPGAAGLAVLPAVLCHLAQTALDFAVASAWVARGRRQEHTMERVV